MKGKVVHLNLSQNRKWEGMIRVLNLFVAPFSILTDVDMKVLGQLLYHYYLWDDLGLEERNQRVFDYDTKVTIAKDLDMSRAHLENCLMSLRKMGFINGIRKTRQLNPRLLITPDFNEFTYIISEE